MNELGRKPVVALSPESIMAMRAPVTGAQSIAHAPCSTSKKRRYISFAISFPYPCGYAYGGAGSELRERAAGATSGSVQIAESFDFLQLYSAVRGHQSCH